MITTYEVIWYTGKKMYVWSYYQPDEDVPACDLPEPVGRVFDFINSFNKSIPVMCYRLGEGSYCSHSNAQIKPYRFDNADIWLKNRGFVEEDDEFKGCLVPQKERRIHK